MINGYWLWQLNCRFLISARVLVPFIFQSLCYVIEQNAIGRCILFYERINTVQPDFSREKVRKNIEHGAKSRYLSLSTYFNSRVNRVCFALWTNSTKMDIHLYQIGYNTWYVFEFGSKFQISLRIMSKIFMNIAQVVFELLCKLQTYRQQLTATLT